MVVAAVLNGRVTAFGSGKRDSQSNASPLNGSDASWTLRFQYAKDIQTALCTSLPLPTLYNPAQLHNFLDATLRLRQRPPPSLFVTVDYFSTLLSTTPVAWRSEVSSFDCHVHTYRKSPTLRPSTTKQYTSSAYCGSTKALRTLHIVTRLSTPACRTLPTPNQLSTVTKDIQVAAARSRQQDRSEIVPLEQSRYRCDQKQCEPW